MTVLERVRRWLETEYAREQADLSRMRRLIVTQLRLYVHVARQMARGEYVLRASALAFASLATLVPVITLSFSMYNAFGGLSETGVRHWATEVLDQYFLGGSQNPAPEAAAGPVVHLVVSPLPLAPPAKGGEAAGAPRVVWLPAPRLAAGAGTPPTPSGPDDGADGGESDTVSDWGGKIADTIIGTAQRASSARVTAAGAALLILTTILLFNTIEGAFNAIWHVARKRRLPIKFSAFCTLLFLGPLLIGASVYLSARFDPVRDFLVNVPAFGALLARVGLYLPPLMVTSVALFLAYMIIPNTHVCWKNALAGAVVAALLWELGKTGFGIYVSHMVSYRRVYGSLAAVPIFLLWIYLTWMIVLFGAGVAYTSQNLRSLVLEEHQARRRPAVNPHLVLALVCLIARRFAAGGGPAPVGELAAAADATDDRVEQALEPLLAAGYVSRTSGTVEGYQPARPLGRIMLAEVVGTVRRANTYGLPEPSVRRLMDSVARRLDEIEAKGLKGLSLEDMIGDQDQNPDVEAHERCGNS